MTRHTSILAIFATAFLALNCAFDNAQSDYLEGQRADNVRDLTPVEAKYIVAPDATTVQFAKQHEELKKVKPGDIIVSDINAGSPQGFIKKVTAVSENAGTTTIQTEPTSITEAVVDGDARAEGGFAGPGPGERALPQSRLRQGAEDHAQEDKGAQA